MSSRAAASRLDPVKPATCQPDPERNPSLRNAVDEAIASRMASSPPTGVQAPVPAAGIAGSLLPSSPGAFLSLQRSCGNQAVGAVLQRTAQEQSPTRNDDALEASLDQARGSGSQLDMPTRRRMESAFGTDLSMVRVHTDARADALSRSLGARAFTTREDIFFRQGQYDTGSPAGRELIAHELTHFMQQTGGAIQAKLEVSQHGDPLEVEADQMARAVMQQEQAALVSGQTRGATQLQRDPIGAQTAPAPTATSATPDPNQIWRQIETRATPELLIKLQEIGRRAAGDTQAQIDDLFKPYEDALESDQTFLQIAGIGLGGAANMPQGGGGNPGAAVAGGLAGAAGAGVQVAMTRIMDFKSVGQVKAKAGGDVGDAVAGMLTSDSELYLNFETEALAQLRTQFDASWAQMSDEAKSLPAAVIEGTYVNWFQMNARLNYGVGSPAGSAALGSVHGAVESRLVPVQAKLEDLKSEQRVHRAEAGALGGAATGALIGGALGAGVFSIPGALIGGAIGGIGGALAGYFW